ncbi:MULTISPECIES: thiol reductant ABC exporter subunit CydC [Gordonibacter]|uniref:Thiol reductant ABC exporter subunit CydC n=1 Tax=Gordonibacter faecis TaxID=3047475 RepID=A0ABT7DMM1_9ACTN|nr:MULTISPECIES: thiol reductant ABC exporter subunit CydC [unclassified Gordonibacter]MDJ1650779.1 thiol reductant ABC exporter subunit CydC [Gordonibacter sp. KGMB12511]HIW77191.1 thiol reductant ABC exporter subunit CydC [Candidatus Gordonibacter avicola]
MSQNKRETDRWVRPFFKRYRKALALALVLGVATFAFASGLMVTSGYLISAAAALPASILMIHAPTIFVRIFGIGKPILQYLERLTSHDWVLRMTSSLRLKLYATLERDAVFFRRSHRTGDILGLLAEDIGHLQNLYLRTVFPVAVALLVYALGIVVLGLFSPWFALVLALVLGVEVFLVPLVSVLANRARIERRKALKNNLYGELTDNVLGASDWIFAGRGQDYLDRYRASQDALRALDRSLNRFARWRDVASTAVFGAAAVLLLAWAGGYFGGAPGESANWIAAFVLGFFPLIDAFAPLPAAATETNVYRDSIRRLNELPEEESEGEGAMAAPGSPTSPAPTSPAGPVDLRIDNVTFCYPGTTRDVLRGVSLHIPAGQKLAVLGCSGSGKSTLASLIRGDLAPTSGRVTLNGTDASSFGDAMAAHIGVIQQQTYLFNMTLRENLRVGNPGATDEHIRTVLDQVGLKPLVDRLPDELDTLVDEAGLRFSGGERHRIALARVLLQDTPVILLDEPTVGLDPATERALLDTIFRNAAGKTLIMITHHLQGVANMDQVVFVEDGLLELSGAPAELERTSERYRRLLAFDRGSAMA